MFNFTHCLVRGLPDSFSEAISHAPCAVDVQLARAQLSQYVSALKSVLGPERVLECAADEACPDCIFVEDVMVVHSDKVLFTRPGAESRRAEVAPVKELVGPLFSASNVREMSAPHTLDGGDVLNMGDVIFVGASKRTSKTTMEQMASWFNVDVLLVDIPSDILHLKCVCTLLDESHAVVLDSESGRAVWEQIARRKPHLQPVWVRDIECSNVVRVRNHVIIPEGFKRSTDVIRKAAEELGLTVLAVPTSEGNKKDGSLTCLSVLFTAA